MKKHGNIFKNWLCPNFLLLPKKCELPKIWGGLQPPACMPIKRFLKILKIKKLTDVKNGSEYIGKKGNPIYNDIKKKKYGFIKIRITF